MYVVLASLELGGDSIYESQYFKEFSVHRRLQCTTYHASKNLNIGGKQDEGVHYRICRAALSCMDGPAFNGPNIIDRHTQA
jgi:hypothetical protein